jgi:hypothetical protein
MALAGVSLAAGAAVLVSAFFTGSCGLVAGSVGIDAIVGDFAVGFVIFVGSVFDFVLSGGFVSGAAGLRGSGSNSGASIKRTGK